MALLSVQGVRMSFGGPPLLASASLHLEPGERVCLLGRNGSGKSTLLKCIAGELVPDNGQIVRQQELRISFLPQEVPQGLGGTVFDLAAGGLGKLGACLAEYQQLSAELAHNQGHQLLARLDRLQHSLDTNHGWHVHRHVEQILSRLELDPSASLASLSGGLKRRALLAAALVSDPDLLLLDEPTNHLDIAAIGWLEEFLLQRDKALLFVTHDRMLLRKLATRIVELDRGQLTSWPCAYETFLQRKQAALAAEAQAWARLDKKIAQEETWIRQGITARRTRNEGRVRALQALRAARQSQRQQPGSVRFQVQDAPRSGKRVIQATDLSYGYRRGQPLVQHFSTTILRGDTVGIIGPNGSGKTTLLQLLLGLLPPQHGTVEHGVRLQVAYFDQLRMELDEQKTVRDMVSDGHDTITLNGKQRHIVSYLQDFLFPPERAQSPVKALSGGERSRLLLARLFLQPSNVLVLDEPTNDLDADTLELLEALLLEYAGTVLLVSHDRALLNHVATSIIAFEGKGQLHEYVGGYDDWLRQRRPVQTPSPQPKPDTPRPPRPARKKLSYTEQQELRALPDTIEQLEAEQRQLHRQLADPELYRHNGAQAGPLKARLSAVEHDLEVAFARWEALEAVQQD